MTRWRWRTSAAILLGVLLATVAWGRHQRLLPAAEKSEKEAAEKLYREGILPNGEPLRATRSDSTSMEGQVAACANCHRRSGFGVEEGRIIIPPISGKYLFRESNADAVPMVHPDPGAENAARRHNRYSAETLARAIREGVNADGRSLDYLMPRYPLDDASMTLLTGYLKHLSVGPPPGEVGDILQFATIVTPDADPAKRDAMLEVLNHFFGNKNAFNRGADPPIDSERRVHFRVLRRWQLHVWQLEGSPDTWEEQLRHRLKAEPVFAVISGVGGKTWEPVQRFCESESVPCLFPNVDLPVVDEQDFYPVYFTRGVLLEADVIAARLANEADKAAPRPRIVQVFRPDDIGAAAAKSLAAALAPSGAQVTLHELKDKSAARELAGVARNAGADEALVLWLRPDDLKALPRETSAKRVFVSGLMGGLENAPLPARWRQTARMTYPFALPQQRTIPMDYPMGWFMIQHIKVVDWRTQTDTYLACSALAQAAASMLDNFYPDYLIERLEVELSHRLVNADYPRLGLAPGQRFASKGAYLVRFAEATGPRIVADGDWTVP